MVRNPMGEAREVAQGTENAMQRCSPIKQSSQGMIGWYCPLERWFCQVRHFKGQEEGPSNNTSLTFSASSVCRWSCSSPSHQVSPCQPL